MSGREIPPSLLDQMVQRRFKVTLLDMETNQESFVLVDLFTEQPDAIRKEIVRAVESALRSLGIIRGA